jgi:hypothetical protein
MFIVETSISIEIFGRAQNIETEKNQIREDHLKIQTHTMKYNLIFGGIEQTALDYEEETEAVGYCWLTV